MRILCDVDGVFADFIGHTFYSLGELAPEGGLENITSWDILESLSGEAKGICTTIWRSEGWCEGIPPYPHSREVIRKISTFGKIVWVTSPMSEAPHWHYERAKWLYTHFGSSHNDIVFTSDKSHVWGDVLIDDRIENLEDWVKSHPKGLGILWDQPYNRQRTPPGTLRAYSWFEVFEHLTKIRARSSKD